MKGYIIALVASAALLAGCGASTGDGESDPSAPGGPGLTYNGKLGFDMGGGVVVPYDGSRPGLGFGY